LCTQLKHPFYIQQKIESEENEKLENDIKKMNLIISIGKTKTAIMTRFATNERIF
jgi:hypothetical protein